MGYRGFSANFKVPNRKKFVCTHFQSSICMEILTLQLLGAEPNMKDRL